MRAKSLISVSRAGHVCSAWTGSCRSWRRWRTGRSGRCTTGTAGGVVRLTQPVPGWADLVDLGLTEVRAASVPSPQADRHFASYPDRQGSG